jgi:hypothetical protein
VAPARQPLSQEAPLSQDAACGADPEFLQLLDLVAGPGDELVEPPGVDPRVGVGPGPQRAPAGRLALDTQPQDLEFFQVTQR